MSAKVWTGGGTSSNPKSGTWGTKTNWSPIGVPGSGDDVTIAGSGSFTVTLSANATCNTLTINNSAATVLIGNHTLKVGSSGASAINLLAGQITINGGTITDAGGIALASNTTLVGTGSLKISGAYAGTGSLQASGGTLDVFGTISSGVVLKIDTASASTLKIEGTGTAAAAISITSSNQTLEIGPTGTLTINAVQNLNNGKIQLDGGTLTDALGIAIGGTGQLLGSGQVSAPLSGSGAVVASGGTLDLTGTVSGVTLKIDTTAHSDLKVDGAATTSAIAISAKSQTLEIGSNGNLTISVVESISNGTIQLDGGTLTDASGLTVGSGASLVGAGTVAAPLSGAGTITASGGTLDLTQTVSSGPSLRINSTVASDLKIDGTAAAAGNIPITSANQTLEIGANGNLTINGNESITSGTVQLDGGGLTDTSGLSVGAGAHLTGFGVVTAGATAAKDVDGTGNITAKGGTLEFKTAVDGNAASAFDIADVAGSVLKFDSTVGTSSVAPIITFDGANSGLGTLDLTSTALANFHAVVANFAYGDQIKVANATSVSLDSTGKILTVFNGSAALGTITFSTSYTGDAFSVSGGIISVANPPSVANSQIIASPTTVTADGTSTTTLTVTLKDAFGNPVGGTAVTLSASGSDNTFGRISGTTNASGVLTTTLASTLAQTETVTATEGSAQETTSAITFVAGAPSGTTSTITANPTTVATNGTATTLTVTVEDAQGNLVAGTAVTLSASGSDNTFGSISGTTDASGVFTTTLASTLAQSETVTATEGSAQETTTVTVNSAPSIAIGPAGTLTAFELFLTFSDGGSGVGTFALDSSNNTLLNASVTTTSGAALSGSNYSTPSTPLGFFGNGTEYYFALQSATTFLGDVVFHTYPSLTAPTVIDPAYGDEQTLAGNSYRYISGGDIVPVTVIGVGQTATISIVSLSETGNTAGETFTVTLTDAHGLLSANTSAAGGGGTIIGSGGTNLTISGTLAQVNADLTTLSDNDGTAGSDTITVNATDGFNNTATQQTIAVTVNGLPVIAAPEAETIGLSEATAISGVSLSESGNTSANETFTVTLTDAHGLLSANTSAAGGGGTITGSGGTNLTISGTLAQVNADLTTLTDNNGTVGSDNITVNATDGFNNTATQQTIAVTVKAGPPSAAKSTLLATPSAVTADGVSTTTLTVTVEDAQGNPVAGTAVTLSASGSDNTFGSISGTFGSVSGTTNASGVFTTTLASTLAQTETVTATEGSAQETTSLTFVASAPSRDNYVWATVAGSWDNAANWNDTTTGQNPASVAPGSNDVVTINAAGGGSVNVITGIGDSALLTINGPTVLEGQFTTGKLNASAPVTVSTGDTLTVTSSASINNFTVDGTSTVDGNLSVAVFTLNSGMLTVDGNLSVSGHNLGTNFTLNGGTVTAGSLTLAGDEFSLNSGATLSITGDVTGSTTAPSDIFVSGSAFTESGTLSAPTSISILVSNSGHVQVAAVATGSTPAFTVQDSTSSLEIGTAGGVAAGSLTLDTGVTATPMFGSFDAPNILINGTLAVASGGNFTLDGSLGGNGQIQIGSGSSLSVRNDLRQPAPAAATAPTITFLGSNDALTIFGSALNASDAFVPVIIGLNNSDVIDYAGTVTSATPGSFNGTDTVVTLYDNTTVVATLTLQGDYSSNTFYAVAPFSGATQIGELGTGDTATAPAGTNTVDNYVWATVAGSWDNAANWNDTTTGQNPASVAPGSNDVVTINAAGGGSVNVITGIGDSALLTINGPTVLEGQFTTGKLNASAPVTVSTGDTLTVTSSASINNFTVDGTSTVDGNLSVAVFTLNSGMLTVDGNLSVSGHNLGTNFTLNGGTVTAGSLTLAGDEFSLNSGATLSITGDVTGSTTAPSDIFVSGSAFTESGTLSAPTSISILVSNSGHVQVAAVATGSTPAFTVQDSTSSLEIGTAGGVAAGSLTLDTGVTATPMFGSFDAPNILINGTLAVASGGNFTLDGSLGGNGQIQIGSGSSLSVRNDLRQPAPAAATAPTITFLGSNDALTIFGSALNASDAFVPVIIGLNNSDVIDYAGTVTSATPGSFNGTDTVVTLYDNTTVVATLTLQGDYSSNTFITTQIGGGVTQIVDPPPPTVATASGGNSEISSTSILSNNATGGTTVVDPPASTSPPTSILDSLVAGDLPKHSSLGLNNALTTAGVQDHAPPFQPGLEHVVALFNQFIAAGFPDQRGGPISNALSQIATNDEQFLTHPHHA